MNLGWSGRLVASSFFMFLLIVPARAQQAARPLRVVERLPAQRATLYSGRAIDVEVERVWKPICGSDTAQITEQRFQTLVDEMRAAVDAAPAEAVSVSGAGLDIVFNIIGGLPAGAAAGLANVEAFIESQFTDPVTISVTFRMQSMGPGVLGATSSSYAGSVLWPDVVEGLQAGMDGDDVIHDYLPTGPTIPVRYDASSSTITNETRVFFTIANFKATIGSTGGAAASMTLNTDFSWDYDPSDGVTGFDFQSVVAHEVGHALGFVSGVDFRTNDIESLDIYRFQRTDGSGDWNPDNYNEFQNRARTADFNNPNDDANSDIISAEYRMEDGSPRQASHFRDNMGIGIMDPTAAAGETFYPNFYRMADLQMFDAMGWDFVDCNLNAVADQQDLAIGGFEDANANGQLDVCERNAPLAELGAGAGPCDFCIGVSTCIDGTCYQPKNRYVSLRPQNPGSLTALRVTEVGSGRQWWVGEPNGSSIAELVAAPEFRDWSLYPETIHVGDCAITPGATYEIQSLLDVDDPSDEGVYSPAVALPTVNNWGDVTGLIAGSPPDGTSNFSDITAVVDRFRGVASARCRSPHGGFQATRSARISCC